MIENQGMRYLHFFTSKKPWLFRKFSDFIQNSVAFFFYNSLDNAIGILMRLGIIYVNRGNGI